MLDTNVVSHIIRNDEPRITARLVEVPMHHLFVSVISEAELLYGLAKRGYPHALSLRVQHFLLHVTILPWHRNAAQAYGRLRASSESLGVALSAVDMLIAAHAAAACATLVSCDRSFSHLCGSPPVENWAL